jgi:hypothetical protein
VRSYDPEGMYSRKAYASNSESLCFPLPKKAIIEMAKGAFYGNLIVPIVESLWY